MTHLKQSGRGGQNANFYWLTLDAAKHFALSSKTSKAAEVREFFVRALDAVQDYHLLTLLAAEKRNSIEERHSFCVRNNVEVSGCYIGIVGYKNGVLVAKIGSTDDLTERVKSLRHAYGSFWCYEFIRYRNGRDLERAVKADPFLATQKFELSRGGVKLTELYKVTDNCDLERYTKIVREHADILKKRRDEEWNHKEKMLAGETELLRHRMDFVQKQSLSTINTLNALREAGFSVPAMENILVAHAERSPPYQPPITQQTGNGLCEADSDDESYLDTNTEEEEADRPRELVKDYIAENLCEELGMMVVWNTVRVDMEAWAFRKDRSRSDGDASRKLRACHTKELWDAFKLERVTFRDQKPGPNTTKFARCKGAEGWRFIDARKPSVRKRAISQGDAQVDEGKVEADPEGEGDCGEDAWGNEDDGGDQDVEVVTA